MRRSQIVLIASLLFVSCNVLGPDVCDSIEFSVSADVEPVISWTPKCVLHELAIVDREWMKGYWSVDGNITPPVRYGIVPRDARDGPGATPLHPDSSYLLLGAVRRGAVTYVGQLEFSPRQVD